MRTIVNSIVEPAGTVSDSARATRSPCAVCALSGRTQFAGSDPSGTSYGMRRSWTNTTPSMVFLYALSLADFEPVARRSAPQASLKKPFIW